MKETTAAPTPNRAVLLLLPIKSHRLQLCVVPFRQFLQVSGPAGWPCRGCSMQETAVAP